MTAKKKVAVGTAPAVHTAHVHKGPSEAAIAAAHRNPDIVAAAGLRNGMTPEQVNAAIERVLIARG